MRGKLIYNLWSRMSYKSLLSSLSNSLEAAIFCLETEVPFPSGVAEASVTLFGDGLPA